MKEKIWKWIAIGIITTNIIGLGWYSFQWKQQIEGYLTQVETRLTQIEMRLRQIEAAVIRVHPELEAPKEVGEGQ